jgi:nucleoid DNA-binding protein
VKDERVAGDLKRPSTDAYPVSRCIIHVGMHKTGTSSIQQSLNGFASKAFVYADFDEHPNHAHAIFTLLGSTGMDRPRRRARLSSGQGIEKRSAAGLRVQDRLQRSVRSLGQRKLLISGEGIMFLSSSELQELAGFFGDAADEVGIVAYVRPPASYITSLVQQRVKGGSIGQLNLESEYCHYQRSFSKFDEVFGRENVHLWKFDPKSFPGGCVVRDFCTRLGIDLPSERIVRVNESLSREAVGLLFTYRKLGQDMGSKSMTAVESYELSQQLMNIGSTRFRFSPDVISPVLERHCADIKWMEARLGRSLDEDLGEHRPTDVRDESDLLNPDPGAVNKLLALLGKRAPAGVTGETPGQVALLVHALRGEHVPQFKAGQVEDRLVTQMDKQAQAIVQGNTAMKATELIAQIQKSNPQLLKGIPEERAEALVAGVFKHMNDALAKTEEGAVNFAGLGQFRVRQMEREVDGKKITRTLINFRPTEPGRKAHNASGAEADWAEG